MKEPCPYFNIYCSEEPLKTNIVNQISVLHYYYDIQIQISKNVGQRCLTCDITMIVFTNEGHFGVLELHVTWIKIKYML